MAARNDPDQGVDAQGGGVQSVDRALQILDILARRGDAGVSEIAEEMGVHKSTVSRLVGSLVGRELVRQNSERGKYQLGFGILRLASSIPGRLSVVHEAREILESLAAQYKETVNLAVLRSNYDVNVDQAMGPSTLATHDWVGSLTPLHATSSGKVLLAALAADEGHDPQEDRFAGPHAEYHYESCGTREAVVGYLATRLRSSPRGV